MRKVHLISVDEPIILDLALAIRKKEYLVSVSGEEVGESVLAQLSHAGCTCYGSGWFPEILKKDIHAVVIGGSTATDNPELVRARELGILVQSVPEFIYHQMRTKTRVVVVGCCENVGILSMMVCALNRQKLVFDYVFTSPIPSLPSLVQMSYESRIVLLEGHELAINRLDSRFHPGLYRPHIAVLSNQSCQLLHKDEAQEEYRKSYQPFSSFIEREGKLLYDGSNPEIGELAEETRNDITAIPYTAHEVVEHEGQPVLQTRYGNFPVCIPDDHFLTNLNAARLVCRQLGVKDTVFYEAVSEYSLSLRP